MVITSNILKCKCSYNSYFTSFLFRSTLLILKITFHNLKTDTYSDIRKDMNIKKLKKQIRWRLV